MEHEPTWSPFKQMCGLAFVGYSRVTDFAKMAFKYVPDYWSFQSMADTDMFRWRAALEQRLDELHDKRRKPSSMVKPLSRMMCNGIVRGRKSAQAGRMSDDELADLTHMLSLRGCYRSQATLTSRSVAWPVKQGAAGRSARPCAAEAQRRAQRRGWPMGQVSLSVMKVEFRPTKRRTGGCT